MESNDDDGFTDDDHSAASAPPEIPDGLSPQLPTAKPAVSLLLQNSTNSSQQLRDSDRKLIAEATIKARLAQAVSALTGLALGVAFSFYVRSGRGLRIINYNGAGPSPPIPLRPRGIVGTFGLWVFPALGASGVAGMSTISYADSKWEQMMKKNPAAYSRMSQAIERADSEFRTDKRKTPMSTNTKRRILEGFLMS